MAGRRDGEALRWHDALRREGAVAVLGDGELLGRFLDGPGAVAEAAFEAMVRRHGPMVLGICRGILRNEHEAEDAFQATFLVLGRRAASVRDRDRLAHWLSRTARRIALRARAEASRREARELRSESLDAFPSPAGDDLLAVEAAATVRDEVERLPEADRRLVQMTYWQGQTYEQAAASLSWPIGTVRSRLSRARERLRGRLARLGWAPAIAAAVAGEGASAATPAEALVLRTVRAATCGAGGVSAVIEAGAVPASVAAMVEREVALMRMIPWKSTAALLILGGGVTAGLAAMARPGPAPDPIPAPAPEPAAPPAPQAKAEGRSLLANSSVEEGMNDMPKAWSRGASIPGVTYVWSREGHTGKASLGLKKTAARYFPIAEWTQTVARPDDAPRLKVSAWIKAQGVTKAILDAQFLDKNKKWSHAWVAYIGAREDGDPPVTHGWTRYEGVVAIPPGTTKILIAPQIYGPGTVWFDDLAAETTDAPASTPAVP